MERAIKIVFDFIYDSGNTGNGDTGNGDTGNGDTGDNNGTQSNKISLSSSSNFDLNDKREPAIYITIRMG